MKPVALALREATFGEVPDGPVVGPISLELAGGEVVGLAGEGAGTVLRGIVGDGVRARGEVELLGRALPERRRGGPLGSGTPVRLARTGVVLVPAQRCLFDSLTVAEHLGVARRRSARHARCPDPEVVLERFPELRDLAARRAGLLSGGERQLLAIARAVAAGPRLLLVEDLGSGLAPRAAERVLQVLHEEAAERGVAVLVADHRPRGSLDELARVHVLPAQVAS